MNISNLTSADEMREAEAAPFMQPVAGSDMNFLNMLATMIDPERGGVIGALQRAYNLGRGQGKIEALNDLASKRMREPMGGHMCPEDDIASDVVSR